MFAQAQQSSGSARDAFTFPISVEPFTKMFKLPFLGNALTSEKPCLLPPKPIFRGEFIAFSEFDRSSLRKLIRRLDKKSLRIAEIGSWTGDGSTKTVVDELRKSGGVLYCVDHWQGNPGVQRHRDLVSEFDMFATFRSHVSTSEANEFVRPLVMSSRDAAELVKDCFFDLVFIDGDHSYDETVCDIELWLPKITPGGILCGHDCEARPGGILDRSHLWPSRNLDTIDGNSDFPQIHPGVILAVDEKFGSAAHLWSEELIVLEDGKVGKSTIWDVSIGEG